MRPGIAAGRGYAASSRSISQFPVGRTANRTTQNASSTIVARAARAAPMKRNAAENSVSQTNQAEGPKSAQSR